MKSLTSLLFFMATVTAPGVIKDKDGKEIRESKSKLISATLTTDYLNQPKTSLGVHLPIAITFPASHKTDPQNPMLNLHKKKKEKAPVIKVPEPEIKTEPKEKQPNPAMTKIADDTKKFMFNHPMIYGLPAGMWMNKFLKDQNTPIYFDLPDDPDKVLLQNGEIVPRQANMPRKQVDVPVTDEDYDDAEDFPGNPDYLVNKKGKVLVKKFSPKNRGEPKKKEEKSPEAPKNFFDIPGEPDKVILPSGEIIGRPGGTQPNPDNIIPEEDVTDEDYNGAEEFSTPNDYLKTKNGKIIKRKYVPKPFSPSKDKDNQPKNQNLNDIDEKSPRPLRTGEDDKEPVQVPVKQKRRIVVAFHLLDCGKCTYEVDRERFLKLIQQ